MRAVHPISTSGRPRRAYSLLEVLITILIIQIISSMVMVNVSSVQTEERLSRAAQQMIVALRYARVLAMTTGQPAGVEFNTSTGTFRVFQGAGATTVSDSFVPGGSYSVTLSTHSELAGVTISNANLTNSTSNPYRVTYGNLGSTTNYGSVYISYGGVTKQLVVDAVSEPKTQ